MREVSRSIPARDCVRAVLVLGLACLAAPLALAAQLVLDNGDRITGDIVQLKDQSLTIRSPLFGEVKIPWRQVVTLTSDEGLRIRLVDGTHLAGQLVLQADDGVVIAQDQRAAGRAFTRADIAQLNPPVANRPVEYSGHATLGGTFNRGNSNDELLNIDAGLVARMPDSRYTLGMQLNEAQSRDVTTTSRRQLSAQYDAFLSPKHYAFLNARAQTDAQADLDLRTSVGAGYGRQFIETELSKLSAEVGLNFVRENYHIAPDRAFPAMTLGLNIERKLRASQVVFFNTTNLSISLEDSSDALLGNKIGFRVPIANGLNLSTQLNVAHDQSPPVGVKKTDSSLVLGVGYVF